MFSLESFDSPVLYILTLNKSLITDEYIRNNYLSYLYPEHTYLINKETGEKQWVSTKKYGLYDRDLEFINDRWSVGKVLSSLKDKTCFCIAEYGNQPKGGTPYIDSINMTFKNIINTNMHKYNIEDVSEGLSIPTDKHWENNTGEKKPYVGYIDPRIKGTLTGWMRDNKITIKKFLENPRYILFLDSKFNHILETLDDYNMISDKIDEIYCV